MTPDEQTVIDSIAEPLAEHGIEVEDVKAVAAGKYRTLTVIIDLPEDTAEPVSLEHIATATRIISESIDPLPLFKDHPYNLEVTSPGAARPLTRPRHFRRVGGRTIAVRTADREVRGELVTVTEDAITLREDRTGAEVQIALAEVEHAEVVLRFR